MLKTADLADRADFSFGPLQISPSRRRVSGPAGEVSFEPLTMRLLVLLIEGFPKVITRDRLFDECWGGSDVGDASLNRVITMLRRSLGEAAPGAVEIENVPRTGYRLLLAANPDERPRRWWPLAAIFATALGGAVALGSVTADRSPGSIVVAVESQGPEPISSSLAKGIRAESVSQGPSGEERLRIVEAGSTITPDFVLRIEAAGSSLEQRALLTLLSRDRELLWSSTVGHSRDAAGELATRVSGTALAVLSCAGEARLRNGGHISPTTMRRFLPACVRFDSLHGAELRLILHDFERIVAAEPQFPAAWSRLFLAYAEVIEANPSDMRFANRLRPLLARFHREQVAIPESYLAKAAILPPNAWQQRLAFYELGLQHHPQSQFLHLARAWSLRAVGRAHEAIEAAKLAAQLHPRSPAALGELANGLMYSGNIEAARTLLAHASKRWPDAENIADAQFRLALRYDDPSAALRAINSGERIAPPQTISFLRAREDPTAFNIERALADEHAYYRAEPDNPGGLIQALGQFGRTEEVIRILLNFRGAGTAGDGSEILFRPALEEVRRDPRFMVIANNFNLLHYWTRSGHWPDFCSKPDLPYDCKAEAMKLRPHKLP